MNRERKRLLLHYGLGAGGAVLLLLHLLLVLPPGAGLFPSWVGIILCGPLTLVLIAANYVYPCRDVNKQVMKSRWAAGTAAFLLCFVFARLGMVLVPPVALVLRFASYGVIVLALVCGMVVVLQRVRLEWRATADVVVDKKES